MSGEDAREGITAVISVKLTEAQFEGQTKAKLGNAHIRTLVDSIVNDQLAVYLEEHPVVARTILDKAMTANRAREAARRHGSPSAARRCWAARPCRISSGTATRITPS